MGKRKPEKQVTVWNTKGEEVVLPLSTAKDMIRNDGKGEGGNNVRQGWTMKNPAIIAKEDAAKLAVQAAIAAQNDAQQAGIGVDPSPTVTKGLARLNELRAEANRLNIPHENTWGIKKLQEVIANVKNGAGILPEGPTSKSDTDVDEFGDDNEDDGA